MVRMTELGIADADSPNENWLAIGRTREREKRDEPNRVTRCCMPLRYECGYAGGDRDDERTLPQAVEQTSIISRLSAVRAAV